MLTTRMSPKISEKPLATMNSKPANVSPLSSVRVKLCQSSIAEPNVVVRQLPPMSGVGLASTMMYRRANPTRRPTASLGASRRMSSCAVRSLKGTRT